MAGALPGKAELLTPEITAMAVDAIVRESRYVSRDYAMLMLSERAGLRPCEMAGLTWSMVLTGNGEIATDIHIHAGISKTGDERDVEIAENLAAALLALRDEVMSYGAYDYYGPVLFSQKGGAMTANTVSAWFSDFYRKLGLRGFKAYSGRRAAITRWARNCNLYNGSIYDAARMAGHKHISTTQGYLQLNKAARVGMANAA